MTITLSVDGNEIYRRDVTELPDCCRARLLERVDTCLMSGPELRAWGAAKQAEADAKLSPEQRAERERIAALTPDERAAEFATRQKLAAEAQLAKLPTEVVESAAVSVVESVVVKGV